MTGGATVAWVPQHPTVLRGSVADNIRLGDATASDARVLHAAALAGADGFIEALPRGHETLVGDGGRPLSAGERRRLGLARAFLRDAPLVVLDEPTADLDPLSAELVADAVERVCAGRTVLLIAHRPELVRRADRVVRLERGRALLRAGTGGGLMATLRRLLALAGAPPSRVALAVVLGALTVVFGAGLMATAGYLITRAAEQPAILSLMTAIVAVRFFGIARPLARYFERLASHDLALRVLGRVRVRVYERIEPLAPAQLEGYSRGDLLSRMVADVDALQNLYLRGVGPPLVALLAGAVCVGATAAFLPAAALVLAVGLLAAGVAVPAAGGPARKPCRRAAGGGPRRALDRARGAPRRRAGARRRTAATAAALGRLRAADQTLVRIGRRDALAAGIGDGLGVLVAGLTVAIVLALSVGAHAAGELDRVLIAMLALLALASFEAVQPLSAVARELPATLGAGARILELIDREPAVVDPAEPAPLPSPPFVVALEDVSARYAPEEPPRAGRLQPPPRARAPDRAAGGQWSGQDDRREPAPALPRPRAGARHARRERPARLPAGRRPPGDRRGRPGLPPVLGKHPRERPARTARGQRRRDRARARSRPALALGPRSPGRLGHARGRAGPPSCRRGSGSGWSSPGPCSPTLRCSCSTSPPRTSTRQPRSG